MPACSNMIRIFILSVFGHQWYECSYLTKGENIRRRELCADLNQQVGRKLCQWHYLIIRGEVIVATVNPMGRTEMMRTWCYALP